MTDSVARYAPTNTVNNVGWSPTGAVSVNAALADSDVNTWAFTTTGPSYLKSSFTAGTPLPSGSKIKAVYAEYQVDASVTGYSDFVLLLVWAATGEVLAQTSFLRANNIGGLFGTYTTPAVFARPDGGPFTQSDVDSGFHIEIQGHPHDGGATQARTGRLVVQYNQQPTVTPSSPADAATVTTSSKPSVAWTYSDPEGDPQERYRVKAFSGTGTVTDPDNLTSGEQARLVWDSGEVLSSAGSVKVGAILPNASYRWYVKVSDAGSDGRFSAWATRTFTISITAAPVPTLLFATPTVQAAMLLVVQPGVGTPAADYFVFQRSYDGGVTYEDFRESQQLAANGSNNVLLEDPYTRRAVIVRYRVAAGRYVSAGEPAPLSAWSTHLSSIIIPDGKAYLKSSTEAAVLIAFRWPIGNELGWTTEAVEDQGVFDVEGREGYVVIGGTLRGEVGQIALMFETDAAYLAFEAFRKRQEPVLLQTCYGGPTVGFEQYWVRLGPTRSVTRYTSGDMLLVPRRRVTIGVRQVEEPV